MKLGHFPTVASIPQSKQLYREVLMLITFLEVVWEYCQVQTCLIVKDLLIMTIKSHILWISDVFEDHLSINSITELSNIDFLAIYYLINKNILL